MPRNILPAAPLDKSGHSEALAGPGRQAQARNLTLRFLPYTFTSPAHETTLGARHSLAFYSLFLRNEPLVSNGEPRRDLYDLAFARA